MRLRKCLIESSYILRRESTLGQLSSFPSEEFKFQPKYNNRNRRGGIIYLTLSLSENCHFFWLKFSSIGSSDTSTTGGNPHTNTSFSINNNKKRKLGRLASTTILMMLKSPNWLIFNIQHNTRSDAFELKMIIWIQSIIDF